MKFPYYKLPLSKPSEIFGKSILRPYVPIKIKNGGKSIDYLALIDSGVIFVFFMLKLENI